MQGRHVPFLPRKLFDVDRVGEILKIAQLRFGVPYVVIHMFRHLSKKDIRNTDTIIFNEA
jgi:hypothetical protein